MFLHEGSGQGQSSTVGLSPVLMAGGRAVFGVLSCLMALFWGIRRLLCSGVVSGGFAFVSVKSLDVTSFLWMYSHCLSYHYFFGFFSVCHSCLFQLLVAWQMFPQLLLPCSVLLPAAGPAHGCGFVADDPLPLSLVGDCGLDTCG